MDNYTIIRNAILQKKQIFADYQGFSREFCPHAIGKKDGINKAMLYQFGGGSSQGQITKDSSTNWRCIPIDKLTNVRAVEGKWHTFGNHSQSQTCITQIDIEVEY